MKESFSSLSESTDHNGKKPSTPRISRAVPQPSTDLALYRFAMEFGWDPAYSIQYGRRLLLLTLLPSYCSSHYRNACPFIMKLTPPLKFTIGKFACTWSTYPKNWVAMYDHRALLFMYFCRVVVSESTQEPLT